MVDDVREIVVHLVRGGTRGKEQSTFCQCRRKFWGPEREPWVWSKRVVVIDRHRRLRMVVLHVPAFTDKLMCMADLPWKARRVFLTVRVVNHRSPGTHWAPEEVCALVATSA